MKNLVYYLDKPGGNFKAVEEEIGQPQEGELRIQVLRTSVCQSDVVIYKSGLARIKEWPAILMHEVSARVESVGEGVEGFEKGDIIGIGCDIPCGDLDCIYCGNEGTGDWTSCPNTQATGHEFPGFARKYAILPSWLVSLGPIINFGKDFNPDHACQLEPLACGLEGMTRVNRCIENRIVVLIGAGSQSTYALQCAKALEARKIILINRGVERLERVHQDFGDQRVVALLWDDSIVERVKEECKPFNEPHFIMMNAPCEAGYRLACELMGYGTVMDGHAGVKGASGKPKISHEIDLNQDIHYKLQCYQATHGSSMHGINLAADLLSKHHLPDIDKMTKENEKFKHSEILQAIERAADKDSLKVIINWED